MIRLKEKIHFHEDNMLLSYSKPENFHQEWQRSDSNDFNRAIWARCTPDMIFQLSEEMHEIQEKSN